MKAAAIILPVLGCTWVFGLLAVNEDTVAFAWIFTILNSLQVSCFNILSYFYNSFFQGAFILFFYVLKNEKV